MGRDCALAGWVSDVLDWRGSNGRIVGGKLRLPTENGVGKRRDPGARLSRARHYHGTVHQRSTRAQETREYWEVAHLNMVGLRFVGGDLEDHTTVNNIIGAYVRPNSEDKVVWDCTPASIEAYGNAIKSDAKFPFSYFYRASCAKVSNTGEWETDADQAKKILLITTRIPGHTGNHDDVLKMLLAGNLGHKV